MAKFTAPIALNQSWHPGIEIDGAVGVTHRIPDALVAEFIRDVEPHIPGGVTWITQDETSSIASFDPDLKYDKTGGTISGAVTATGAISAATLSAAGALDAATVAASGAISGASASVSGAIVGASISASAATVTGVIRGSAVSLVAGPIDINGGAFSKPYDTDLWIAGASRANPVLGSQAIYTQHRVSGDLSSTVHDAAAFEIRLDAISNATFLSALEASVVVTGGANTIPDTRGLTVNLHTEGTPTGTITAAALIRAQTVAALAGGFAITTLYGLYVEPQTVGGTNYSIYAPTGTSRMGVLQTDGDLTVGVLGTGARTLNLSGAAGSVRDIVLQTAGVSRWILRANGTAESGSNVGSDLQLFARTDAGGANVTPLTITRSTGAIAFANVPMGFFGTTPVAGKTGWGVPTGTLARATYATYTSPNISATYVEAEVQAIADALQVVSRTLGALVTDTHQTAGYGLLRT